VARDRQRAKARKQRRAQNPGPKPTEPHRANVPGELDHASGEVDGFEAALVGGADGAPDDQTSDAELEHAATAAAPSRRTAGAPAKPARRRMGGPRFVGFLRASWAELQRVQWPDRRQVTQATSVVIGFVIISGAYLGVSDWVAQKFVDLII
jgi:preprotein translocase subunit SecE